MTEKTVSDAYAVQVSILLAVSYSTALQGQARRCW